MTLALSSTPVTLTVKWRGQRLTVETAAGRTVGSVKDTLAVMTAVPADRVRLMGRGVGKGGDEETVAVVFGVLPVDGGGAPVMREVAMLGTPVPNADVRQENDDRVVVDDLDELVSGPVLPSGAAADDAGEVSSDDEFERRVAVTEEEEDVGDMTNGAMLGLEAVDGMLASDPETGAEGATVGEQFTTRFPCEGLHVVHEPSFLGAVGVSKREMKMLAVLLFDFGDDGEEAKSRSFLETTLRHALVKGTLNESFAVFPADLGTLPDRGSALLNRIGLHAVPAVLLLGDVGTGISVVDMFNAEWYGDLESEESAMRLGMRLQETLANFDGFYETARARRVVADSRVDMIREQDEALQRAQEADMAAEREAAAAAEAEQRAEEERIAALELARMEATQAAADLPTEPEGGGARLAVRMPDGTRVERRFRVDACVRDVFNLCVAQGLRRGSFALSMAFPRKSLSIEHHGDDTLLAVGLVPTAMLNVDLI